MKNNFLVSMSALLFVEYLKKHLKAFLCNKFKFIIKTNIIVALHDLDNV